VRIDAKEAVSLAAVLRRDVAAVRGLISHGNALIAEPEFLDRTRVESLGYTLHNVYNALENSFTQISMSFENHVKDRERWHRELLEKMFLDLTPLRQAVLSSECRSIVSELLAFRHLFRHAYDFELQQDKLLHLWQRFISQASVILGNVEDFSRSLDQVSDVR
jgi:hypothetical protein